MNVFKSLTAIFFFLVSTSAIAQLKAVPTFVSCSIYFPAAKADECIIQYKRQGEGKWNRAFMPVYDSAHNEYRVSIVKLTEATQYQVKAETRSGGSITTTKSTSFNTWSSHVAIATEKKLSSFFKKPSEAIEIEGLNGSPDGWIKIIADKPLFAGNEKEYALKFINCSYLIIEGLVLTGGYRHGIFLDGTNSDIRIINADISHWGRAAVSQDSTGHFIDKDGKAINNDAGIKIDRARNIVIERCYIHDANCITNPWEGVITLGKFAGKAYTYLHPQGGNAMYIRGGGGLVLRYNDFAGSQTHRYNDPVEGFRNDDADGSFNRDADIYGNLIAFGQDDAIELDGGQCNVRLFGNRIEQTFTGISTAPNKNGPSYIFNNVLFNPGNSLGASTSSIKNGGGVQHSLGIQFFFNNTIISNGNVMTGVGYGCREPECKRELFYAYTRNNIFISTQKYLNKDNVGKGLSIFDKHLVHINSFDYDHLSNTTQPDGKGGLIATEGSEQHGVSGQVQFTQSENGVFTLAPSDKGINKGKKLANFSNGYKGDAPDMGAFEVGTSGFIPIRPIDITADKYTVKLTANHSAIITLTIGKLPGTRTFHIRKSEDMDWLTVEPSAQTLQSNSTLQIKLSTQKVGIDQKGMLFIRLANGWSVPISVFTE